jgi:hypothetical protein
VGEVTAFLSAAFLSAASLAAAVLRNCARLVIAVADEVDDLVSERRCEDYVPVEWSEEFE